MKRLATNAPPLVVENHPNDYEGYPFITLIQQARNTHLTIVDNMDRNVLGVFVLDLCSPEYVDESQIVEVAANWYNYNRHKYPVSIEFSRKGITAETSKIYRTFNVDYVARVIGPVPVFPMTGPIKVKRRKKKEISKNVRVQQNIAFHEHITCLLQEPSF